MIIDILCTIYIEQMVNMEKWKTQFFFFFLVYYDQTV